MSILDKRDFNDFEDDNSELVSLEVPLVDLQRLNEMVERLALITLLWIRIRLKRKLYVDEHLLMLTYPLFPFTTMHDPRYFKGSVYHRPIRQGTLFTPHILEEGTRSDVPDVIGSIDIRIHRKSTA